MLGKSGQEEAARKSWTGDSQMRPGRDVQLPGCRVTSQGAKKKIHFLLSRVLEASAVAYRPWTPSSSSRSTQEKLDELPVENTGSGLCLTLCRGHWADDQAEEAGGKGPGGLALQRQLSPLLSWACLSGSLHSAWEGWGGPQEGR